LTVSVKRFERLGGIFDPDTLQREIDELEKQTADPVFWNDHERAETILTQLKRARRRLDPWQELKEKFEDLVALYGLAVEEKDQSVEREIKETLEDLEQAYREIQTLEFLGGEHDSASAFLTIHSGAGGTEACDWVSMLLRMYTRWAERKGLSAQIVDFLEAEGGLKSVTLHVTGDYAYGRLRTEVGIHRLVRISPFDSNKRRHTSFASVFLLPEIEEDIDIEISHDELRIDTYRAQGAGGQHVNKTDSAVRITHLPTGIVAQCQNERSQHKNKAMAMKVLKSRLYDHYKHERDKEIRKLEDEKKDISWGNQIRSYVFHPYTMVKDHRTSIETGNVQAVMDGDIDQFIEEYLKLAWSSG
jgi:peptide chain release factor 2